MKRVLFLTAVILTAVGCGSARRSEPLTGRLQTSNPKVAEGRILFMRHCYACHGNGEGGMAPPLNNKPAPGFLIKTQVRVGLGAMPSFKKNEIPPEDLDKIVAYMLALRKQPARDGK
jgi:mono/diheme cytochrome c family protein